MPNTVGRDLIGDAKYLAMWFQAIWTRPTHRVLFLVVVALCVWPAIAQGRDTTFSPYYSGQEPGWVIPGMNASGVESQHLARHWKTNTAYWDVGGVPVYIGTPGQLDKLGQRNSERWMQSHCAAGIHRPRKIVVLTAGAFHGCVQQLHRGKYFTRTVKDDEITFTHEVLEFLVDPAFPIADVRIKGHIAEVCDWVDGDSRYDKASRMWIPDFVYPAFFTGGHGPYDFFGKVKHPLRS